MGHRRLVLDKTDKKRSEELIVFGARCAGAERGLDLEEGLVPGKQVDESQSSTVQLAPTVIFDPRNEAPGRSLNGGGGAMIFLSKELVGEASTKGS